MFSLDLRIHDLKRSLAEELRSEKPAGTTSNLVRKRSLHVNVRTSQTTAVSRLLVCLREPLQIDHEPSALLRDTARRGWIDGTVTEVLRVLAA